MKELYTEEYLINLLRIINWNLEELAEWSVYNEDIKIEEITQLQELFRTIKRQLTK